MCLVNNREDLIGTLDSIGDKASIDTDKYMVLGVRNNGGLANF
jgi:hypothetical protein